MVPHNLKNKPVALLQLDLWMVKIVLLLWFIEGIIVSIIFHFARLSKSYSTWLLLLEIGVELCKDL